MCRALLPLLALALVAPPAAADDPARALEKQMRALIDAAEPSVVAVVVSQLKYPAPFAGRGPGRLGGYAPPLTDGRNALPSRTDPRLDLSDPDQVAEHRFGSGLVLEPGLVLTNHHLIAGATKVYVRAASGKGSYADVHAADSRCDLAVLRLIDPVPGTEAVKFAAVRLFDGPGELKATVARGSFVVALGHPLAAGFADGTPSASWGIVSNVRRRTAGPGREELRNRALHHYGTLLQTDARVTLGSSGGGLFDLDGKLVGMSAPLAAVTGADTAGGFAVPFDRNYRRFVDALRQGREVEYGFLGVALGPEERVRRGGGPGVVVGQVTPGSPAAKAGLVGADQAGDAADRIVAIDGQPVRQPDDLFLYVGASLAGSKVRLTVQRDGRPLPVDVALAKFHHTLPWFASEQPESVFGLRTEYTSVEFQKNGGAFGGMPPGVAVRELEPNTAAATRFAALGGDPNRWLVTHVDGRAVSSPPEFVAAAAGKEAVRLRLMDPNPRATPRERTVALP